MSKLLKTIAVIVLASQVFIGNVFAAGPDHDHGDWNTDDRNAIPFNVSNGIASNGDIWRSRKLRDIENNMYSREIVGDFWE